MDDIELLLSWCAENDIWIDSRLEIVHAGLSPLLYPSAGDCGSPEPEEHSPASTDISVRSKDLIEPNETGMQFGDTMTMIIVS